VKSVILLWSLMELDLGRLVLCIHQVVVLTGANPQPSSDLSLWSDYLKDQVQ